MKPFSSLGALDSVPDSAQEGATAGAQTAIGNFANPANFITKPLGEAAKLPFLSTLTNSSVSQNSLTANKTASAPQTAGTGSGNNERPRPLKKAADDFNSSLKKFADSLQQEGARSAGERRRHGVDRGGLSSRRLSSRWWLPH